MAKTLKIDTTSSMNPELEDEAIRARFSGYKTKSARGRRDAKITLTVPKSLFDELKDIAAATGHPTNDVINQYLEEYAEENAEIGAKYRELMGQIGN